jgi:repressor LexA
MNAVVLTPRQQQIFEFIRTEITTKSLPPTRKEVADHFGFRSCNAAEEHIKALVKRGVIQLVPGAARGIRLVSDTEVSHVNSLPQAE